jgi:hypothetical protein
MIKSLDKERVSEITTSYVIDDEGSLMLQARVLTQGNGIQLDFNAMEELSEELLTEEDVECLIKELQKVVVLHKELSTTNTK